MSETAPTPEAARNAKAEAAAAKAYAKAQRPWYKKKRFIMPLVLVALMVAAGVCSGGDDTNTVATDTGSDSSSSAPAVADAESSTPAEEPVAAEEPAFTASQENAIQTAENYLDTMPFSRLGLIRQLSSKAGSGFPHA